MMTKFLKEEVVIIGKANPHGSKKYKETVCTGAVTMDGELRRIYPVPFRYLEKEKQFERWDILQVAWSKSTDSTRPESFKLKNEDSFEIIGKITSSKEKRNIIKKVQSDSIEDIEGLLKSGKKSLAMIQIRNAEIYAKLNDKKEEDTVDNQLDFFLKSINPLKNVPYSFHLKYNCYSDKCKKRKHNQIYLAWDPYETLRKLMVDPKYQNPVEEVIDRHKKLRLNESKFEIYLLLTTHFRFPRWMIGGIYNCKKVSQLSLL